VHPAIGTKLRTKKIDMDELERAVAASNTCLTSGMTGASEPTSVHGESQNP
jgi:hypothetical protein